MTLWQTAAGCDNPHPLWSQPRKKRPRKWSDSNIDSYTFSRIVLLLYKQNPLPSEWFAINSHKKIYWSSTNHKNLTDSVFTCLPEEKMPFVKNKRRKLKGGFFLLSLTWSCSLFFNRRSGWPVHQLAAWRHSRDLCGTSLCGHDCPHFWEWTWEQRQFPVARWLLRTAAGWIRLPVQLQRNVFTPGGRG